MCCPSKVLQVPMEAAVHAYRVLRWSIRIPSPSAIVQSVCSGAHLLEPVKTGREPWRWSASACAFSETSLSKASAREAYV